ncbi:ABC transporter ATP-binding protein [Clostridium oceanicum]|uniref:ABC transporter ATP-binding protein n=1 Tax=Clostridium oceanicum TaxID=1543 RepID=A0ABN1J9V0_9CLOT
MIKVSKVAFNYDKGRTLFKDLSFEVKKGETLAVLGPNGTGKTTFIKCLMGFFKFRVGEVFINNISNKDINQKDFWKQVGYVPQAKNVSFGFSVLEMVVMGLSPYIGMGRLPKKEEYSKAKEMLKQLGILHLQNASCNKISGGQLQMVLIARTLIKDPKILIMDEPESNLDLKNQMKILNIIEKLNSKKQMAIIINTHFPHHALKVAQNTLIIGENNHVLGSTKEIVTKENMKQYFDIDTEIISYSKDNKVYNTILPLGLSKNKTVIN